MALENTDPRVTVTNGNGVLYAFNFNWKILAETELSVYVETAAGFRRLHPQGDHDRLHG
jgi:hypothetical protein